MLTSKVKVVVESVEVQDRRDTRSYFCALIDVMVKVSSKSNGSDMAADRTMDAQEPVLTECCDTDDERLEFLLAVRAVDKDVLDTS